jgi:hypothetical protein
MTSYIRYEYKFKSCRCYPSIFEDTLAHYSGPYYDKKDIYWTRGLHVGEEISTLHDDKGDSHWAIRFKSGWGEKCWQWPLHMHLLENKFIPALHWCGVSTADNDFQQDWNTPHMSWQVFRWWQKTFGHNLISIKMDCGHHIPPIEVHRTFFYEDSSMSKCKYTKAKHPGGS